MGLSDDQYAYYQANSGLAEGTINDHMAAFFRQNAGVSLNATFVSGNPTLVVTYNGDGTVATTTENGVLTTFTYNTDGTVHTQTRAGITKTFSYDANGNVTEAI